MTALEPVIGLEVHAELQTQSKMFCACAVLDPSRAAPNTSICEVCTGMPGSLPVVNARAVEFALRVALAVHGAVAAASVFARKNYFYPDLPKGYQISQFELPLSSGGWLDIESPSGAKRVRIRRIHLEEDTAKLFHRQGYSLVDYNRSGVPLLEIVTEPDLHSLEEVKAYATALRTLLRYLQVNSGDMEKGVIRFEANVSLRPAGAAELGTRTEIKNLNSFRSMMRAVGYEIQRQGRVLAEGGPVAQETLGWDEARGITFSQRGKEEAHDYRYFPEPDLPPLLIEPQVLERLRASQPELPEARRARLASAYGLSPYLAGVLTADRAVADYFEAAAAAAPDVPAEKVAHWVSGDLFALLNQDAAGVESCRVSPHMLGELAAMVERGEVSAPSAKAVLAEMFARGSSAAEVVAAGGWAQLNDSQSIAGLVAQTLAAHPDQLAGYLAGKTSIEQWFFGQVMRAAGGRANPALVKAALRSALDAAEGHHATV